MEESRKESYLIHHEVAEIGAMPRDSDDEEEEEEEKRTLRSWDAILPDELLQKVLSLLPIANIIKLGIVCKRWYEVVHSCPLSWAMMAPQKPLFFRSCFNDCALSGRVYDPCFLRWHNFDFPRLEKSPWRTSSSCGLVCLMNPNDGSRLLVGNPINRDWKLLPQVPGGSSPHYNALTLSFDRRTRGYTTVVAKCTAHLQGNGHQWHLSVHIYESTTKSWTTPFAQDIGFWMGSNEAVICDGVLYYFILPYTVQGPHLVAFDLAKPPSTIQSLIQESIPAPYPLACAGLINLSNKLVMVGRTDWYDWPHRGVVILELEDKTWREVAQMPISMCRKLCSENFICCGAGDFLFMHSLVWPALLTFDMRQKVWKWSSQCQCHCPCTEQLQSPVYVGFCFEPRSLFYCGFCFEPRLDVSS